MADNNTILATDKLRDEMAKQSTHPGIAVLGDYMTARLQGDPSIAAAILADGKTLSGAFDAIRDYASKHRTGSFAYVPPEKAFEICAGYYGILPAGAPQTQAPAVPEPDDTGLDLDALLGV